MTSDRCWHSRAPRPPAILFSAHHHHHRHCSHRGEHHDDRRRQQQEHQQRHKRRRNGSRVMVPIAMAAVVIVVPAMATQCTPFLRESSFSDGRDGSLSGLGIYGDPQCRCAWHRRLTVSLRIWSILFLNCSTSALLGYCLDGHLSKIHPSLWDRCGLARCRGSR